MDSATLRFRIRISLYLLILITTITTVAVVYISQIDLNDYRVSLEQRLTFAFNQPVKIGSCKLTFNRGLAIALDDLQIGPDDNVIAAIPYATATLKIRPLLRGQFILDHVQVNAPQLTLRHLLLQQQTKEPSQSLFHSLGITTLNIQNGNLAIYPQTTTDTPQKMVFSDINIILRNWNPGEIGHLVVTGKFEKYSSNFILETKIPSTTDSNVWRNEKLDTTLQVTNLPFRSLIKSTHTNIPQFLELNFSAHGVPATGTHFNVALTSSANQQKVFSVSGNWTSTKQQDALIALQGELFEIPLKGEFTLLRQIESTLLSGQFGVDNFTLTPQLLQKWQIPNSDNFITGNLDQLMFSINQNWSNGDSFTTNPSLNLNLAISALDWDLPKFKQLNKLAVELQLENQNLKIKKGTLNSAHHSFFFSGNIDSLFHQPQIDLELNFSAQVSDFVAHLNLPDNWKISGNIPGALNLHGSLLKPTIILQADLNSINASMGMLFQKKSTDNSKFYLHGYFNNNKFQLDKFAFNLNDFNLHTKGYVDLSHKAHNYHFTTNQLDFDKLRPFSPLLERIKLTGTVKAEIKPQDDEVVATVKLNNGGAHIISFLGDITNTSGTVRLDRHGFTFKQLNASLGESPFKVNGTFTNWFNPLLVLDVDGKKVRAQDIVFSNRHLNFYNLTGQLQIDANSIRFTPIKTRLEDDTIATVKGEVKFSNPVVDFDISAEQADVLDIINLFIDDAAKVNKTNEQDGAPLNIKIAVAQGNIGGLNFKNATGLITGEGHQLAVYPLNFKNEDGWCNARIEFDFKDSIAPLKVSGHAENINASTIHKNVFEKKGLVSGRLKGDFYIEGNPGDNDKFWEHARGGIHLQIEDGTLRKFHGLAKVFSLLNVSQIFAGKLPDMNTEGMPFSLVDGSVSIGAGKAKINDLKITSVAMNLSVIGTSNLVDNTLDLTLGVMPLRTVDKIISAIPLAGWILTGEDKALITAHFKIEGDSEDPQVSAVPISSVSKTVLGIFKRTFGLPGKVVDMLKTTPTQKATQ